MEKLINDIIQKNKPKNVDKIILDIEFVDGDRYGYRIKPHYVLDKDSELMNIIWKDKKKTDYVMVADSILSKFEQDMVKFIQMYTGVKVYFSGRGVTEKEYWLKNYGDNTNNF